MELVRAYIRSIYPVQFEYYTDCTCTTNTVPLVLFGNEYAWEIANPKRLMELTAAVASVWGQPVLQHDLRVIFLMLTNSKGFQK